MEVRLTYSTPDGPQSITVDGDKLSLGRGSEADHRIADDGLSRLHAILYRDGPRVWIVDQNSTNGTFVNDVKTAPAGTPLHSGDRIKIGNQTVLTVSIGETPKPDITPAQVTPAASAATSVSSKPAATSMVPIVVIAAAIFVISISVVFIGLAVFGPGRDVVINRNTDDDPEENNTRRTPKPTATNVPTDTPVNGSTNANTPTPDPGNTSNANTEVVVASGKKYLAMSDTEKRQYLEVKAMRIAQVIGNNSSEKIPDNALNAIKASVEGYASRINSKTVTSGAGCKMGGNLQATYERARKNAPFIVRAFNEKGVDPRVGIYLAMIESEHCNCLASGTGALGMFQFIASTAQMHYVPSDGVRRGASPSNPDIRCEPEPSAKASASYMKALLGRFGTGPASVPLAIGSYNSGEGGLSSNLEKALATNSGLPRDFWTLIANGDKLSKQFQSENFRYVPKFFAAAIVGENPQDFGLTLQPISSYSN